jgi:hypothetical protein
MAKRLTFSERFWGPIHFSSGKASHYIGSIFGDIEVRVQGSRRVVALKAGSGRARGWEELTVAQARKLAADLLVAADVAERLPESIGPG